MKTPVCVVRLPRGPDPHGRGFDPTSPRYLALCPSSLSTSGEADPVALRTEQRTRAMMRERFLRCLISMANKKIQFLMYEKGCTPSQRTCVLVPVLFYLSMETVINGGVTHLPPGHARV
ncbi:gem-associated protein 7 isoform X2 [Gadus morhua]|uniref:gem-associated protein 7 isoform X2 n=1 Tax=Gadus morhua TaxID=8049 RepID=UPI0011B6BD8A|nr:gem-associated protein 7 isoform X2 [Gadus morhua]